MKRITITALMLALLCLCGCGRAAAQPGCDGFASVSDVPHKVDASIRCVGQLEADEPDSEWTTDEWYDDGCYEPTYYGDGFMQQGVRAGVDSDTETWYSSSNPNYVHYRIGEWTTDDEGYWRDSDGYYVVASNDYPEGSVVTTSKGEAKVYDDGTDSGNIDMYVAW